MKQKKYDYDSFQLYTVSVDRFKRCYIEVIFRDDIRDCSSCARNFLANYMVYTSHKYPTFRKMMIETEELYHLDVDCNMVREGYNLFTSFSFSFIHPKYVKEKNYLFQVLDFIMEILLRPNFNGKSCDEKAFPVIKERIHTQLDLYKENPENYVMVKSLEELFPHSVSGQRILGTHEMLDNITPEILIEEYQKMFQNSYCEIGVIGNLNMDEVAKYFKENFYKPSIVTKEIPFDVDNPIQKPRTVEKESNFNQTRILKYYQVDKVTFYEKYFVSPIFAAVLGDAELEDKLSRYLRRDESLCYQCGFYTRLSGGYAAVFLGTNEEHRAVALQKIQKAMKEMGHLENETSLIESQKESFLVYLKLKKDQMYSLFENYYFHEIQGSPLFEEYQENIPKVSGKDLENFSKKFHESLVYIMKEGTENEKN